MNHTKAIIILLFMLICCSLQAGIDHGTLWGRFDDDHPQYLRKDGTRPLDGAWDVGSFPITALRFVSDVTDGTAPYACDSNSLNVNLNADLWDGFQFADYLDQAVKTTSSPSFVAVNANTLSLSGGSITDSTGVIDFEDTDWIGVGSIVAGDFTSVVSTGTAPFFCDSTTMCENLNADMLDGEDATDFYKKSDNNGVSVTLTFTTTTVGDCNSITVENGLITDYTVVE